MIEPGPSSPPPTIAGLLAEAADVERREVRLLLAETLDTTESLVLGFPETRLSATAAARFRALLDRRRRREPVAYLLGRREFWGRRFRVDDRVLIPRPETEHAIEAALALDLAPGARVLDLGTGSGCLAVTLACERPTWSVTASDASLGALAVARLNARSHGVHIEWLAADWASALGPQRRFDLVISNPPYIDPGTARGLAPDVVGFEPPEALFAADRGWADIEAILHGAPLAPAGFLILELGHDQSAELAERASASSLALRSIRHDLAGIPRTAVLQRQED